MTSRLCCRRGQFFGSEILAASLLFLAALALAYILWSNTITDVLIQEDFVLMESASIDMLEQLLTTPGEPADWSSASVRSLGLASESRVLDGGKVGAFVSLMDNTTQSNECGGGETNYECNKGLMGLGETEFQIVFSDLDGNVVLLNGVNASTGTRSENETREFTLQRSAILDGEVIKITMRVWK